MQQQVKARIELKPDGPISFTGRVRPLRQGEAITITDVSDIHYFKNCGHCTVTMLQGELPEESGTDEPDPPAALSLAESEPVEDDDGEPVEAEADEVLEADGEEQDGGTDDEPAGEADESVEAGEPVSEEQSTEETAAAEAPSYVRAELELLSKAALIGRSSEDGLDLKLSMSMSKTAIIDAMMGAVAS